jgi:hypothetical protein
MSHGFQVGPHEARSKVHWTLFESFDDAGRIDCANTGPPGIRRSSVGLLERVESYMVGRYARVGPALLVDRTHPYWY